MRPDAPEMNLPPGKTCQECIHYARCFVFFKCKPTNDNCDFSPSRFEEWPSESARKFFTQPRPELKTVTASNSHAVLIAEIVKLKAERAEAERKGKDLCNQNGDLMTNVLRLGRAWSLLAVLEELEWVANHTLDEHDYDGRHGHESIRQAVTVSKEIRAALATVTPTRAEEWDGVMDRAHKPVFCAKCGRVMPHLPFAMGPYTCPECCKIKTSKEKP